MKHVYQFCSFHRLIAFLLILQVSGAKELATAVQSTHDDSRLAANDHPTVDQYEPDKRGIGSAINKYRLYGHGGQKRGDSISKDISGPNLQETGSKRGVGSLINRYRMQSSQKRDDNTVDDKRGIGSLINRYRMQDAQKREMESKRGVGSAINRYRMQGGQKRDDEIITDDKRGIGSLINRYRMQGAQKREEDTEDKRGVGFAINRYRMQGTQKRNENTDDKRGVGHAINRYRMQGVQKRNDEELDDKRGIGSALNKWKGGDHDGDLEMAYNKRHVGAAINRFRLHTKKRKAEEYETDEKRNVGHAINRLLGYKDGKRNDQSHSSMQPIVIDDDASFDGEEYKRHVGAAINRMRGLVNPSSKRHVGAALNRMGQFKPGNSKRLNDEELRKLDTLNEMVEEEDKRHVGAALNRMRGVTNAGSKRHFVEALNRMQELPPDDSKKRHVGAAINRWRGSFEKRDNVAGLSQGNTDEDPTRHVGAALNGMKEEQYDFKNKFDSTVDENAENREALFKLNSNPNAGGQYQNFDHEEENEANDNRNIGHELTGLRNSDYKLNIGHELNKTRSRKKRDLAIFDGNQYSVDHAPVPFFSSHFNDNDLAYTRKYLGNNMYDKRHIGYARNRLLGHRSFNPGFDNKRGIGSAINRWRLSMTGDRLGDDDIEKKNVGHAVNRLNRYQGMFSEEHPYHLSKRHIGAVLNKWNNLASFHRRTHLA